MVFFFKIQNTFIFSLIIHIFLFKHHSRDFHPMLLILLDCTTFGVYVPSHPGFARAVACIVVSRSPPCVFSILPHLAFRHATITQWCCVTGQAGQWLFVSIQINHSLFWTDNAINVQKGRRVHSSQAWWGECWGQRSDVNTLDWLLVSLWGEKKNSAAQFL